MDKSEDTELPIINPYIRSDDTTLVNLVHNVFLKTMKYNGLLMLTIQNALLSILMRLVRTQPELFITSTAVLWAEGLKLLISLFAVYATDEFFNFRRTLVLLDRCILKQPMDTLKVSIPSFLYFVQNNLLYIGATHLDAATCQVTYQLKILTTALFSVVLLHRRLHTHQWVALLLLFLGVALVQVAQLYPLSPPASSKAPSESQHALVGLSAVVAACCLSGLAGVYFEKILKGSLEVSVFMRNVQLCITSIPIGLFSVFVYHREEVAEKGFHYGYTQYVWAVIFLQAIGGIIVAIVVSYADNILKGFATSLAIILSCAFSVWLFDFQLTFSFVVGSAIVISSIFLYSKKPKVNPLTK